MAIEWASTADKHGVPHEDALHAVFNATWHVSNFEPSRIPGGIDPDGWIGPSRTGEELEVFAELGPAPRVFIFHVMPAREVTRQKFRRVMNRRKNQ
jgi:hypothetical protein